MAKNVGGMGAGVDGPREREREGVHIVLVCVCMHARRPRKLYEWDAGDS